MKLSRGRALRLFWLAASAMAVQPAWAADLSRLTILGAEEPRAFFFRQAEGAAARQAVGYEQWARSYGRLMGVMGKVLEEEVPGRSRGLEYFARFKREHPAQAVLLHVNGNARDPRFEGARFFAGHWLYHNGATVLDGLPATAGEATLRVSDATLFEVNGGRYKNANDDLGLCMLRADGRPDWTQSEQVQLLAVDRRAKTIRVRRGCFGTVPRAFAAGQAYAAAHCTEGPWGGDSHLLWLYNYATVSPRDARGRSCAEVWVAHLAELFGPGGGLRDFDGLEFDVLFHAPASGRPRRGPDCDADGVRDNGVVGGVNVYGNGVLAFCRDLRAALGEGRLLLADGAFRGDREQRATGSLNGIESEGWPVLGDFRLDDWSGGLNRHGFWQAFGRTPVLNYANVKFVEAGEAPGQTAQAKVPFSSVRLAFAGAVLTDSAITYSHRPPGPRNESGVWDELVAGNENRPGWLGRATGPALHLAERSPDLLGGEGRRAGEALRARVSSADAQLQVESGALRAAARQATATEFKVRLRVGPLAGSDLLLVLTARGAPRSGCPPEMARLLHASVAGAAPAGKAPVAMSWLGERAFTSRFYFRNVPAGPADVELAVEGPEPVWIEAVSAHAGADCMLREFAHGLVLANPSDRAQAFALATLASGRVFRRLAATAGQDGTVNSGERLGATVTLPPRDALFLRREP